MAKVLSDSTVSVVAIMELPRWCHSDPVEKQEARLVAEAKDFQTLVARHVRPHMDINYYCDTKIERDFACSHCGNPWTEESPAYNGGCCDEDEKNNPTASAETAAA